MHFVFLDVEISEFNKDIDQIQGNEPLGLFHKFNVQFELTVEYKLIKYK